MTSNCRVTHDLNEFMREEDEELMHAMYAMEDARDSRYEEYLTETFHDLEVEPCTVCKDNWPATEFVLDGICEVCFNKGEMFSPNLFQSEDKQLHAI